MDSIPFYTGCLGLNTLVDPSELPHSHSDVFLSSCYNIDITDAKKIKRRSGRSRVFDASIGSIHSCFPTNNYLFFVEGDALSSVDPSWNVTRLRVVTEDARMTYAEDIEGRIFYANGHEIGFIKDNISYSWSEPGTMVGPETTKNYNEPHLGHIVAMHGGFMLMAVGNTLSISEPFDPFRFVYDEGNIIFDSRLKMIKPVTGGVWISTGTKIVFLSGRNPKDFNLIDVLSVPIVEGTDVYAEAEDTGLEANGIGVMVTTTESIIYLTSEGQKIDKTKRYVTLPTGVTGTAFFQDGKYTSVINGV